MSDRVLHWFEYGIDMRTRTVWLEGDVDEQMLSLTVKALHLFRGKPIHFYLSSGGGEETAGLAIYDLISRHRGHTTITVLGSAESMAAIILQAARVRQITRNSYLMIHQGEISPPESSKKNVRAFLKISDHQDDVCDAIVLQRIQRKYPKYSWSKFREETSNDTYFTAEQAKKWGLVDRIV